MTEGGFDSVMMEQPEEGIEKADYDYSAIHQYSDLEQTSLEANLSGELEVGTGAAIFATGRYVDFTDDEPWVYGDLTGSLYDLQVGAKLSL